MVQINKRYKRITVIWRGDISISHCVAGKLHIAAGLAGGGPHVSILGYAC